MKDTTIDRRAFVSTSARVGASVCGLCMCSRLPVFAGAGEDERIDLTRLDFCGYQCPSDCVFLQATLTDDDGLKRRAWKTWEIEARFGLEFDPEQAFCYGCKAFGKPRGLVQTRCTVRRCAIDRGLESCVDCDDLADCDRELWRRFPEFKQQVVEMQRRYRQQA